MLKVTLENLDYNKFKVSEIKAPDFKVIIDKTAHQFLRFNSEFFVPFGSITKSTQFSKNCEINYNFLIILIIIWKKLQFKKISNELNGTCSAAIWNENISLPAFQYPCKLL